MLRGPIRFPWEETAIDRARLLRTALIGFGRRRKDVIAHIFAKHLRLPSKCRRIKLCHPLTVVVWHLKMNDWIHDLFSKEIEGSPVVRAERC